LFPAALGQNMPTPDIQKDTLAALSALMLAQGQEAFALKGINGKLCYSRALSDISSV